MNSSLDRSSARLTRREILALGPMALAGTAVLQRLAFAQSGETDYVEVKTKYGSLRGARDRGVAIFKGVPYGGSVSGAGRFKAAPPPKTWTGVRDGRLHHARACQWGAIHHDELAAVAW
jgi:para-nitrobenzyl esterase